MKFLATLRTKFRKHMFDLETPMGYAEAGPFKWPVYECVGCGKTMCLDKKQMKDLPFEMARGCPGEYPEETVLPTKENPFPRGV